MSGNLHNLHDRFTCIRTDQVQPTVTSHGTGTKQILFPGFDGAVALKQIAVGHLIPGEAIAAHTHADMDEYYFILEGEGKMFVSGNSFLLQKGVFLCVPAGSEHSLQCHAFALRFYYFGLQVLPAETRS